MNLVSHENHGFLYCLYRRISSTIYFKINSYFMTGFSEGIICAKAKKWRGIRHWNCFFFQIQVWQTFWSWATWHFGLTIIITFRQMEWVTVRCWGHFNPNMLIFSNFFIDWFNIFNLLFYFNNIFDNSFLSRNKKYSPTPKWGRQRRNRIMALETPFQHGSRDAIERWR